MAALTFSFIASLLMTWLVVWSASKHAVLSADHDMSGPQKFHSHPVPRIGGVGVFVAIVAGLLVRADSHSLQKPHPCGCCWRRAFPPLPPV
jgi:UDP-N-acetylmuramyl pentapeptide phosphotransferase/UDP-N-acetylglucosamine-1-phosphate transferase